MSFTSLIRDHKKLHMDSLGFKLSSPIYHMESEDTLLISTWGSPAHWGVVKYRINGIEKPSCTSLLPMLEWLEFNVDSVVIVLDSLVDRPSEAGLRRARVVNVVRKHMRRQEGRSTIMLHCWMRSGAYPKISCDASSRRQA